MTTGPKLKEITNMSEVKEGMGQKRGQLHEDHRQLNARVSKVERQLKDVQKELVEVRAEMKTDILNIFDHIAEIKTSIPKITWRVGAIVAACFTLVFGWLVMKESAQDETMKGNLATLGEVRGTQSLILSNVELLVRGLDQKVEAQNGHTEEKLEDTAEKLEHHLRKDHKD